MRTSLLSADELATHTPAQGMPSPLLTPELPPQTPPDLLPETSPPPAEGGSEEIKLPWGILLLVYGVLMSDAIASTVITPFVPSTSALSTIAPARRTPSPTVRRLRVVVYTFTRLRMAELADARFLVGGDMCSKRFGISEENAGMAAGALIGAYNLASFVSSFMLGHLADKYGRKLIVMGGLLSGAVGTILFGFSPNFALAFASRLLAGALPLSVWTPCAVPSMPIHQHTPNRILQRQHRRRKSCVCGCYGGSGPYPRLRLHRGLLQPLPKSVQVLAPFALHHTSSSFDPHLPCSGIGGAFTIIDFSGVPMLADNPFLFPCLVGGKTWPLQPNFRSRWR